MVDTVMKRLIMIDRSLNYGRHHIQKFLTLAGEYHTVLDLGAGGGDDLLIAQNINPQAELFAVELYQEYVNKLLEKDIIVYSLNIEKDLLPFSENSLNIVIANQILEHAKEVFWILHEITRILQIGGKVIIGVPNLASFHNRILLLLGKQPSPIKSHSAHIRGFTKGDIMQFLENCFPGGYKLKAFGGSNFYPFSPVIAKPLAKIFPTMAWGIFFMFEKQREYKKEFLEFPVAQQLETNFYLGLQ